MVILCLKKYSCKCKLVKLNEEFKRPSSSSAFEMKGKVLSSGGVLFALCLFRWGIKDNQKEKARNFQALLLNAAIKCAMSYADYLFIAMMVISLLINCLPCLKTSFTFDFHSSVYADKSRKVSNSLSTVINVKSWII